MSDVRVVSWNIKNYSMSSWAKHGSKIVDVLYNAMGARQVDVFVIIEPHARVGGVGVGSLMKTGSGLCAILSLYYALVHKDPAWKVVPCRSACATMKTDQVAIYYHSDVIDFRGPEALAGLVGVAAAGAANPHGHALPWSAATDRMGQLRFYRANGTEIDFFGRRPYMVSMHAPELRRQTVSLTVVADPGGVLAVATAALPDGAVGSPYSFQLQATGGTAPYTWAKLSVGAPAGALLLTAGGRLHGTPTALGPASVQAEVTDATGTKVSRTLNFTIGAAGGTLAFATAAVLPTCVAGKAFEATVGTKGGAGARELTHAPTTVGGALPAGMTIALDGRIDWAAPVVGVHTFDVRVRERPPIHAQTLTLDIDAAPGPGALAIHTNILPHGANGSPYAYRLHATGGTAPHTWASLGTSVLPAGLALSVAGELTGTPGANGAFSLDAEVTDATGTKVTKTLAFTVIAGGGAPQMSTTALPRGVGGQPYRLVIANKGGAGARKVSHAKTVAMQTLPQGLVLEPDGTLSWAAPVAGTYVFDVVLDDSTTKDFFLLGVHAPPDSQGTDNEKMVKALATIREITALRGKSAVAICGDFNVCPRSPCNSGAAHSLSHRQALNDLLGVGYASHNANRYSSLKGCSKAGKDAYAALKGTANDVTMDHLGANAFDHVIAQGFAAVASVDTVNLVRLDPGYAAAKADYTASKDAKIKAIIKKYFWTSGVSDHAPVKFTLTL